MKTKDIISAAILWSAIGLMTVSCDSHIDSPNEEPETEAMGLVEFRAGTVGTAVGTRADDHPNAKYMPVTGRFVCRMYYISQTGSSLYDTANPSDAWLQVGNNTGNAVYRQNDFVKPNDIGENVNDEYAPAIYWRNRRSHAFLAWTDMNRLSDMTFSTKPSLKFAPDTIIRTNVGMTADSIGANVFDLKRGNKTAMSQQPDIILAFTTHAPTSAILELNRIDLYFKHQFSQVQVNLKNSQDNSVEITKDQIQKVELLGVSDQGYVYTEIEEDGTMHSTNYKEVSASDYTTEHLLDNPFGTSFDMFERNLSDDETSATKIIKSFECITFGMLQAIRVTWKETDAEGETSHISTYRVDTDQRQLKSGVKYIWNMELRRGTLAVIRTEIIPWIVNDENYESIGSVTN